MKETILTLFAALSISLFGPTLALNGTVYAACDNTQSKKEVLKGIDETGGNCKGKGVENFASAIVQILSIIGGIVAVIMILISGFKYITSNGDSNKIASAKTTLIYALVGIAVIALAQVLVNLTIGVANNA